jgi:ribonuclease HII
MTDFPGLALDSTAERPAGVDEVGRGPLAGPVIAAAVILPPEGMAGLADSKALTPRRRHELNDAVRRNALAWGLGRADPAEIDALNIRQASLCAMERALAALTLAPDYAWIDGRECPRLPCPGEPIVGGDGRVAAIAAASILAKHARDSEMIDLADTHHGYGFERHKGYPTREHLAALDQLGPCDLHRRSFAPVAQRLAAR